MLRDIQFGLPAILNNSLASYRSVVTIITCALTCRKWAWQPKNLWVRFVQPKLNPLSKFLDLPLLMLFASYWEAFCYLRI